MEFLPQILLSGLQVGCVYAMMALSYYVILHATGVLNFAQGEWTMLSAVLGVVLLGLNVPYPFAVLGGIAGSVMTALLFERVIIRPLQNRDADTTILVVALLGILVVVRYTVGLTFGREQVPYPGPLSSEPVLLGTVAFILPQTLVVYTVTVATFVCMWLFLHMTWFGRSFRIASIDPIGAQLVGVNLGRVRVASFAAGALIAAVLGWIYAPLYAAGFLIGAAPGIKGFIALLIGGIGSLWGPLIGGLLLGIFEVAASYYIGSIYSEGMAFLTLMIFLVVRPTGVVGGTIRSA